MEDDSAQVIDLPAEFSMGTYHDLLHHFKIVCQMFVHILVHDPEDRDEAAEKLRKGTHMHLQLLIHRTLPLRTNRPVLFCTFEDRAEEAGWDA